MTLRETHWQTVTSHIDCEQVSGRPSLCTVGSSELLPTWATRGWRLSVVASRRLAGLLQCNADIQGLFRVLAAGVDVLDMSFLTCDIEKHHFHEAA